MTALSKLLARPQITYRVRWMILREELGQLIHHGSLNSNPLTLTWQTLWGLNRLHTVWLSHGVLPSMLSTLF